MPISPKPARPQQGIRDRVTQDVGIGMAGQSRRVRNLHTAEHQWSLRRKSMRIETEPDSHPTTHPLGQIEILGESDLDVGPLPHDYRNPAPVVFDQLCVISARETGVRRVVVCSLEAFGEKCLRCLDAPYVVARDGVRHSALDDPLQRLVNRNGCYDGIHAGRGHPTLGVRARVR